MNLRQKIKCCIGAYDHIIKYIIVVLLFSLLFQIFTNQVLSRYKLFLASNYDDLLVNLFTAQVTIIILPLSLFGFFTEMTNEVYLGQSVAEYMYMYKGEHFFSFSYKELVISSMILTLAQYILMSKELLAAELITLVLNTVAMLVTFFSWFEIRIEKEKLHAFIQREIYKIIAASTNPVDNNTYQKERILTKLLSKLKDWVVNGGDFELIEAMHFYEDLYLQIGIWEMVIHAQDSGKEDFLRELVSSYKNTDDYFDEMVADLLRKEDYYRALICSKRILEIIITYRKNKYYHPTHYYYRILINLFRTMSETEIRLLGNDWFNDYLVTVLKNGYMDAYSREIIQQEEMRDSKELQRVRKECYILVYELLMSVWRNDNLTLDYKQKQVQTLLNNREFGIAESIFCVSMKLIESKEQPIIDIVVKENWKQLEYFIQFPLPALKEERELHEKAMVLILTYCYYLAVYTGQDITIPQLKTLVFNREMSFVNELNMWEVLTNSAWKWFDEMKKQLLDSNYELVKDFQQMYDKVICDIMLYSAIASRQLCVCAKNNAVCYNKVVRNFDHITYNDNFFEKAVNRYKSYITLFGAKDNWTDQMIREQFYEFKKMILQYYIVVKKKETESFDKEAFLEELTGKIWEELSADQRFERTAPFDQVSNKNTVTEATFSTSYLIAPYYKNLDAREIKNQLYREMLRQNTDKEEACNQEISKTYDILSLKGTDEELNEKEIERFIEKEQGFKVMLFFYPLNIHDIHCMIFQTYEEAYEFVKSEYRKIVFRMTFAIHSESGTQSGQKGNAE